jgi:hypothetical protein
MGEIHGRFDFLLQVARVSLLCTPLLCHTSARAEPCQSDADAPVAQCHALGSARAATPAAAAPVTTAEAIASAIDADAPPERASISNNAIAAAVADGVSTKLALAAGGIESNALVAGFPMGLVALTGAKILIVKYAETLPEADKRVVVKAASATWGGAAFNNLLVMLAAPPPLAIAAGIVVAIITWRHTASQYDNQDRLAALQKEKNDRLALQRKELPSAPVQTDLAIAATHSGD